MKKHLIVIGTAVLLLVVGLSGCTQQKSTENNDSTSNDLNDSIIDNDAEQQNDSVTIENELPTVDILYARPGGSTGRNFIYFDFSANDSDGYIRNYHLDWGDGEVDDDKTYTTGVGRAHLYPGAGTYNFTLTVTDNNGATSSDYIIVEIRESPCPDSPCPQIIDHTAFSGDKNTYVYGVVESVEDSNIKWVEIESTLYDASNNIIDIATGVALSDVNDIIEPQETGVFRVAHYDKTYYHHYDVKVVDYYFTEEQSYDGLEIINNYLEVGYEHLEFGATIKNVGSKVVQSLGAKVSFYDSDGNIRHYEDYVYKLGPLWCGEETSFTIFFSPNDFEGSKYDLKSYRFHLHCYLQS